MKVLLTGADGFLGSHILRCLLDHNHTVRAFLQVGRSHTTITGLDYEPFYGDILNESDVAMALAGCDAVINTAATTDVWPSRNDASWAINYHAVRSICEAVKRHNIKKMIHIGTANSFGYGTKQNPGTEQTPYNFGRYGLDYMDSKKAAQDYLLREHRDNQLPVVIINPSFMIGEYDSKPGSGAMVLAVAKRKMPAYSAGGRCITYVGDVAIAAVHAIQRGQMGECYIAGGFNLSYQEFFQIIADCAGVRPPKFKLPGPVLVSFGALLQAGARLMNRPPQISVRMARMSQDGHYFSAQKAVERLGMPQTSVNVAVKRAIDWFTANGYLEERRF